MPLSVGFQKAESDILKRNAPEFESVISKGRTVVHKDVCYT